MCQTETPHLKFLPSFHRMMDAPSGLGATESPAGSSMDWMLARAIDLQTASLMILWCACMLASIRLASKSMAGKSKQAEHVHDITAHSIILEIFILFIININVIIIIITIIIIINNNIIIYYYYYYYYYCRSCRSTNCKGNRAFTLMFRRLSISSVPNLQQIHIYMMISQYVAVKFANSWPNIYWQIEIIHNRA